MDTVRAAAYRILHRFEKGSAGRRLKSEQLIETEIRNHHAWSAQDRAFLTALVKAGLRQWFRSQAWMERTSNRKLKQIEPGLRTLLRLGMIQLADFSQIPDYAAIDTTITLARSQKVKAGGIKFLNANLRGFQRQRDVLLDPVINYESDPTRHLLEVCSWPHWWSERMLAQYPEQQVLSMAQASQQEPMLAIRINTLKVTIPEYLQALAAQDIAYRQSGLLPEVILLPEWQGPVSQLPGFEEGAVYIQDPSSAEVSPVVDPQPDERILDLCAAPGSKTTHMAALIQNRGEIVALEPEPKRIESLRQNLDRLGITNVTVRQGTGETFQTDQKFDRVLVDAPCSGTGTLRRHPEILIQLQPQDFSHYAKQQLALLNSAARLVKPGGVLVYSTCSVDAAENSDVIRQFTRVHTSFKLTSETQKPIRMESDGFYTAVLSKLSN